MSLDPITALFDVGMSVIKRVWPDPAQQAEEERKLLELKQRGDLSALNAHVKLLTGQLEINKIEAASSSLFVSGWRPFVGWVCGMGLLYASILEPLLRFLLKTNGYTGIFPVIDTTITMQVLMGMLGLSVMRTHEKTKNVANK